MQWGKESYISEIMNPAEQNLITKYLPQSRDSGEIFLQSPPNKLFINWKDSLF